MNRVVLSVTLTLMFVAVSLAQNEWAGTYTFDEDGGKTAGGGTVIFVTHELSVFETDDGLRATLKSNGYQTSTDLHCKVKISGNKMEIIFDSYGEDNVHETFSPGDLLLTLEKKSVKGKTELLTWWGKFTPALPEKPKTGKLFFTKPAKIETN
jgi:hypothetical protein